MVQIAMSAKETRPIEAKRSKRDIEDPPKKKNTTEYHSGMETVAAWKSRFKLEGKPVSRIRGSTTGGPGRA